MTTNSSTLDGLPKQFVNAMRTLFEIMDDKQTGFVNFADIEARWQDDGSKGLPKGVIESLRKVTPPNGMLSFERFCAGLKICLLRNQVERRPDNSGKNQEIGKVVPPLTNRPPSAPLLDIADNNQMSKPSWGTNSNNTAAIRPNVIPPQQNVTRTLSMPQLKDPLQSDQGFEKGTNLPAVPPVSKAPLYGPPKPPRTALGMERPNPNAGGNMDRAEIRTALANWQMGLLTNQDQGNKDPKRTINGAASAQPGYTGLLRTSRSLGDGKAAVQGDQGQTQPSSHQIQGIFQKKPNARRREPRRHTLQNGIDYNMLKRMKQIEQEKEVLMTGLSAVEKARDWYLKQVAMVQEKMKYLGRMGHVETWSETQQERIELQRARVLEVNMHLAALTESWERGGLPLHMNLAVHHPPHDFGERLKQQNRILTEEVNKKGERIATLEKEKASLIQVLQMRSQPARCNGNEEAVF
ncbi:suppressor APC domain-containing protein 2 [Anthonomus grandis grandis]|uniref:suppressor APC domain-containing protein 2 n=1 Tax=Anthonomus grandis grandis TaxID=2921223 RepID=UPI0021656D9A|nr:suppressor APC domain-containing protein 2 [Anthonomus grandis grandis]